MARTVYRRAFASLLLFVFQTSVHAYVGLCCGKCGGNMPMNIPGGGVPETHEYRLAAPGFELITLDGETVRLGTYRGRLVLLHFWATFCEPCRKELPAFDRLAGELGADSPVILAVAVDRDRPQQVAKFVRQHAVNLTVPLDPDGKVRNSYEIDALPTTYLIGPDGRFVGRAVGERPWDSRQFQQLIGRLTSQMPD